MRHINPLIVSAGITVLFGCKQPDMARHPPTTATSASERIHVFHNRRDPHYEWVFIVRDTTVLGQRHVFPGYADPAMRLVTSLDAATAEKISEFQRRPGDVDPPFPPPGPWFVRTDVGAKGQLPATVFFANDNKPLVAMLADVQAAVMRYGTLVTEPPDWVKSNPDLMRTIGRAQ